MSFPTAREAHERATRQTLGSAYVEGLERQIRDAALLGKVMVQIDVSPLSENQQLTLDQFLRVFGYIAHSRLPGMPKGKLMISWVS